jgi:CO/xanthine dehydrogenase Mo-binding subunit
MQGRRVAVSLGELVSKVHGTSVRRKEDPALLSGRGRYADDLPVARGTLHAHVVRSPHAHAKILKIDAADALKQRGVWAVVTGEDVEKLSDPFLIVIKAPIHQWSLALERVRYVGEPVALVVADDRYLAEDAAEKVQVESNRCRRSSIRRQRGKKCCDFACRGEDQRDFGPRFFLW